MGTDTLFRPQLQWRLVRRRIGKHRKHAKGKGKAGLLTHRRATATRYHPGLYGKCGIKQFNNSSGFRYENVANLEKVSALIPFENRGKLAEDGTVPKVNLTQQGYTKLLGKGKLGIKTPAIIICESFSKRAVEKIKKIGGVALLKDTQEDMSMEVEAPVQGA